MFLIIRIFLPFRSCYVNGELVSVGDDVIVALNKNSEGVGRILKLYHHSTEEEPYRAEVHWYFKYAELNPRTKHELGQILSNEHELFWPVNNENSIVSGSVEVVYAETIQEKCTVIVITAASAYPVEGDCGYFVRYGFSRDHNLVSSSELIKSFSRSNNKFSTNKKLVTEKTGHRHKSIAHQGGI